MLSANFHRGPGIAVISGKSYTRKRCDLKVRLSTASDCDLAKIVPFLRNSLQFGPCEGKSLQFAILVCSVLSVLSPTINKSRRLWHLVYLSGASSYWVTLLVGVEMSFLGYRDVSVFFYFWPPLVLQLAGCRGPKKHAWVDPRKKTI